MCERASVIQGDDIHHVIGLSVLPQLPIDPYPHAKLTGVLNGGGGDDGP